jgi:hypothetical protein
MIKNRKPRKVHFDVFCSWCGVKIRRDEKATLLRTCLACFYRHVSERLRRQTQTITSQFASER